MKTRKILALAAVLALMTSIIGFSGALAHTSPDDTECEAPHEWSEPEVVYAIPFISEVSDFMDTIITPLNDELAHDNEVSGSGSYNVKTNRTYKGTSTSITYDTQITYSEVRDNCCYIGTLYMTSAGTPHQDSFGIWTIVVYYEGIITHAYCVYE